MQTESHHSAEYLRRIFLQKKERNGSYSTRAFARDIGISQTYLSLILSGKKLLTLKQAVRISALLGLPAQETETFVNSTMASVTPKSRLKREVRLSIASPAEKAANWFTDLDTERFRVLSRWYHLAILDLVTTVNFKADSKWIAQRLNIGAIEAKDAFERLARLGLIKQIGRKFTKTEQHISLPTSKPQAAVRSFHKEMIAKANAALDDSSEEAYQNRMISGVTLAVNPYRMDEAKAKILAFQQEMSELLTEGPCTEVFQLNVQFFPLTQISKIEREK